MAGKNESDVLTNGESKIIPIEPMDQWLPIDQIRTFLFLVVPEILNEEAMRVALDRLIRNHLPILGARVEVSKDGGLAYRLPKSFAADYRLFQWSNDSVESSFADAQLLPDMAQAECDISYGPCSIPELERAWTPSTWPPERKYEAPDTPLLLVHVTKYADATVVSLNIPHMVVDQMGLGSLITAWMQIVKGETPAEFLQLEPGALDGLKNPSKEVLRKKNTYRIMRKSEKAKGVMNHVPDIILHRKETRRLLFLPIKLVESLRDRHSQALKTKYGEETPPLTSNDVIAALLMKLAWLGRKSSRTVAVATAMNSRGRHPLLPADKPFLHNAVSYGVLITPNPGQVPLAELAYKHRLAVVEGLRLETIERHWAVTKELYKQKQSFHIVEPDTLSYSSTNWCGAWRNIDFGPAVVPREDSGECVTAPPLVLGHSVLRNYPTRFNTSIMCKANGGFWCDFTIAAKRFPLMEKLLKTDPRLDNF